MDNAAKKYDFKRHPLRGILTEIASEKGVSRQAVQRSANRGNPDILARIAAKARVRLKKQKALSDVLK